jgi:hypothetical protein
MHVHVLLMYHASTWIHRKATDLYPNMRHDHSWDVSTVRSHDVGKRTYNGADQNLSHSLAPWFS